MGRLCVSRRVDAPLERDACDSLKAVAVGTDKRFEGGFVPARIEQRLSSCAVYRVSSPIHLCETARRERGVLNRCRHGMSLPVKSW